MCFERFLCAEAALSAGFIAGGIKGEEEERNDASDRIYQKFEL